MTAMADPRQIIADAIAMVAKRRAVADALLGTHKEVSTETFADAALDALKDAGYVLMQAEAQAKPDLPRHPAGLKPGMVIRMRNGLVRRVEMTGARSGSVLQRIVNNGAPGKAQWMSAENLIRDAVEVVEATPFPSSPA